jgi:hypothetical protein
VPDSLTSLHALLNKLRADEMTFARATVAALGGTSNVRDTITSAATTLGESFSLCALHGAFPRLQLSALHALRKHDQRNTDI